jgi:hypothetical protein
MNTAPGLIRGLLLAAMLVSLTACGGSTPGGQATPSPSPAASPSPSPLACTPSGPASASFPAAASIPDSPAPIVSATTSGDVLTLTFGQGTPEFAVMPQSSAHFLVGDGRGTNVDVAGTAGAIIVLRGFRGDMSSYTGAADMVSSGPELLEVRHVSEFEGVISWAVGLARPGCANITSQGSTLIFTFIAGPT